MTGRDIDTEAREVICLGGGEVRSAFGYDESIATVETGLCMDDQMEALVEQIL